MKPDNLARSVLGTALSAAARGFALASRSADRLAELIRPPAAAREDATAPGPVGPVAAGDFTEQAEELATVAEGGDEPRPAAQPPPTEPVPIGPSRARSPETHIAALADRTAAEVIDAVPSLSTDELRQLFEHESANKKRKTVLEAVERAASPS